jgi:RNA polymerase sigma-70 factor (ECF subfamily)
VDWLLLARPGESTLTPMGSAEPDSKPASSRGAGMDADDDPSPGGALPPVRLPPVNSRVAAPSNSKEIRAREAEEDRALIAKAQAGDTAAFRSLVERHQRRAFAIAFSLVRDEHDARELVQDAFLRVFKGLGTFQGGSSFFTWLYRIITNLSIDLMRKPGRSLGSGATTSGGLDDKIEGLSDNDAENLEYPLLSRIDGSDPVDALRRREIATRIQTALDALPPYHRSVIVMREVEGLSYDEMAHVMGVSKGTIMSRLFHARQKLQRALVDCYEEQIGVMKRPAPDGAEGSDPPPSSGGGLVASDASEASDPPSGGAS